ncbi:hypothetical protein, partial [Sideroxydans sp. CL21]
WLVVLSSSGRTDFQLSGTGWIAGACLLRAKCCGGHLWACS